MFLASGVFAIMADWLGPLLGAPLSLLAVLCFRLWKANRRKDRQIVRLLREMSQFTEVLEMTAGLDSRLDAIEKRILMP